MLFLPSLFVGGLAVNILDSSSCCLLLLSLPLLFLWSSAVAFRLVSPVLWDVHLVVIIVLVFVFSLLLWLCLSSSSHCSSVFVVGRNFAVLLISRYRTPLVLFCFMGSKFTLEFHFLHI